MKRMLLALACLVLYVHPAFASNNQYDTQLYMFDDATHGKVTAKTTVIDVWVGIKGIGNVVGEVPTLNNQGASSGPGMEVYDLGGYLMPFHVVPITAKNYDFADDVISTNSSGEKIMPLTQIDIDYNIKGLPNHKPQGGLVLNTYFVLGQGTNAITLRASQLEQFSS